MSEKKVLIHQRIRFSSWVNALVRREDGQSVTEYAVVMAIITLVALASISTVGAQTLVVLRHVATNLQ
jgi:Flp pilus assembly pilin Flp